MLSFNSALLSVACDFTSKFAPFQAVEITKAENGGVYLASTDKGNIACFAYDPSGSADENICLLPNKDLMRACKGIKTGERNIKIDGNMATVTTYKKTTNQIQELPVMLSGVEFPHGKITKAIRDCIERWSVSPTTSDTAGRYDIDYINRAIKSLSVFDSSICLCAFDGGPLRIQGSDNNLTILVMPQTAEPIPEIPAWLKAYSMTE